MSASARGGEGSGTSGNGGDGRMISGVGFAISQSGSNDAWMHGVEGAFSIRAE